MSLLYGINRFMGLQDTNFSVCDMDVKPGKTTFTIKHREPAVYICKHCGANHDSYHDKDWVYLTDNFMGMQKLEWKVERMRILCH